MKDKYYKFTSLLIMGVLLILFGINLYIWREGFYQAIIFFTVYLFIIMSLKNLLFGRNDRKNYFKILFDLLFAILILIVPNIGIMIMPIVFGGYLIVVGISIFVMFILDLVNYTLSIYYLVMSIIYIVVGGVVSINPLHNLKIFLICISLYCFLFGVSNIFEAIVSLFPVKSRKKLRRKLRVTLPKVVESFIPYSVILGLNNDDGVREFGKIDEKTRLKLIVHASSNGANRMGHVDICVDDYVYSYGNYNEGSRKYHELIGMGILFKTNRFNEYINFCIDNSKKTLFVYGIDISDDNIELIKNKINRILNNTDRWDYKSDLCYGKINTYASKLYKKTKAEFYKFDRTKYKTYYVLGTNCCYFVDDVMGIIGIPKLTFNGINTPGTFYDYLNKELMKKNSKVIYKKIYDVNNKIK